MDKKLLIAALSALAAGSGIAGTEQAVAQTPRGARRF